MIDVSICDDICYTNMIIRESNENVSWFAYTLCVLDPFLHWISVSVPCHSIKNNPYTYVNLFIRKKRVSFKKAKEENASHPSFSLIHHPHHLSQPWKVLDWDWGREEEEETMLGMCKKLESFPHVNLWLSSSLYS